MSTDKKTFVQELQEQVKILNDGFDIKSLENEVMKNELTDVLRPNILLSQLSQFVLQMLTELIEYEQKNKLNARLQVSKDRLVKMVDITTELSGMGDKMQSLKNFNRELFGTIQLLRIEKMKLNKENEQMKNAFEGV